MTGDLPAAALRLMTSCTVRTHEWQPSKKPAILQTGNPPKYRFRGEVIIGRTKYASIIDAARRLKRSQRTIKRWLESGEAKRG